MNRENKLFAILENKGYINIHDVCRVFVLNYSNAYDRDKAKAVIRMYKDLGRLEYIEDSVPFKYIATHQSLILAV